MRFPARYLPENATSHLRDDQVESLGGGHDRQIRRVRGAAGLKPERLVQSSSQTAARWRATAAHRSTTPAAIASGEAQRELLGDKLADATREA